MRDASLMTLRRWNSWITSLGLLLAAGCPGDDDGEDTGVSATQTATATGTATDPSTTDASTETASATGTTASTDPTNGSTTDTSTTDTSTTEDTGATTAMTSGSTGTVNTCDPVVPGEWNSCVDDKGNIDNTLCNWMGQPDAEGFIGCLTSSKDPESNVCFISDCVDDCDCFAPPDTGTADVVCADVLAGGGMGCILACDQGQTCPDGMECQSGICFHPPGA